MRNGLLDTAARRFRMIEVKPIRLEEIYVLAHQIHVDNTGDPKVNIMSSRIMEIVEDYLGKLLPDEYRDFLPDQDNLDPKAAPVSLSGAAFFVSA